MNEVVLVGVQTACVLLVSYWSFRFGKEVGYRKGILDMSHILSQVLSSVPLNSDMAHEEANEVEQHGIGHAGEM